jgi:hypothetical protein
MATGSYGRSSVWRNRSLSDSSTIWQTPLTSSDTILTWTMLGMAAVR